MRRGHDRCLLQSQEILVVVEDVDIENIGVLKQRIHELRWLGCDATTGCVTGDGVRAVHHGFLGATGQSAQVLRQVIQGGQAQAEGFDGFARGEFFNQFGQLRGIAIQALLQAALDQIEPGQRTSQRDQQGKAQQRGRQARGAQAGSGREVQHPVGVAGGERLGRALGLAALGQHLGRTRVEALHQLDLPDIGRQRRQVAEQPVEVDRQQ